LIRLRLRKGRNGLIVLRAVVFVSILMTMNPLAAQAGEMPTDPGYLMRTMKACFPPMPGDPKARVLRPDTIIDACAQIIGWGGDDLGQYYASRGLAYELKGDMARAAEDLKKAEELGAKNIQTMRLMHKLARSQ